MNRRFSFNKAFWGLLFLLAAAGLVLNQFNFWPNVYNISVTGAIFTLFFLWMLIQGLQHKNFFAIVFALAFMLIQYNKIFSFFPINTSTILGAALLASIGLSMLFPKSHHSFSNGQFNQNYTDSGKKIFENESGNVLHFENNFGSMVLFIPKTWNVEFHTKASFAGVREQGMSEAHDTPILRIYGEVSFGDLLIVYI